MEITSLRAAIDARLAKKGADEFKAATDKMKGGAREATDGTKKLDTGLGRLGTTARTAGGHIGKLFAGVSAAFAIRDMVQTVARYEQTMATVRAVTRAAAEDFARMTELTRHLGATTRFSANEAAEGLLFLARAGFDTDKALVALPHTLDLAAAGMLGLGEAADLASNIVSQFNLTAEETQRVSDALIVVSNRANTDVRQLGEALKYAGPIAGALGASVETTAAALGVLGDRGIQASMAGTNLRGVMLALANPTTDAERALGKMGLSLAEVNPATNDFVDVLEKLHAAEMGATEAGLIFGRRNAAAALILSESTDRVRELEKATKDYAGEAAGQAIAQSNTLSGSFKALRSAVEEAYLATGDAGLAGGLKSVVDTVTGAVRILAGMEDQVTGNTEAAHLLADALKAVGVILAGVVIAKLAGAVAALAGFAKAIYSATAAAGAFLMTNPIGLIVLAVASLTAAYLALRSALGDTNPEMERQRQAMEDVRAATDSVAEAQERYRDAIYDTNNALAVKAIEDQIKKLEELATARKAMAEVNRNDPKGHGSTGPGTTEAGFAEDYRYSAYNPLQERVSALVASQDPHQLQLAIKWLREEEDLLTAAIEGETKAQQDARRAGMLREQLLRSIKDAQGEVNLALAASSEQERAANATREKYLSDALRIAETLGLSKSATDEFLASVEKEVRLLEESRKVLAAKTAEEKAAEAATKAHEQAVSQAATTLDEMVAKLRTEHEVLTRVANGEQIVEEEIRARAAASLLAADAADRDKAAIAAKLVEILNLIAGTRELTQAETERQAREASEKSARSSLNAYVADLERQVTLLGIIDEKEREVADARLRAAELAYRGGEDSESMAQYVDEVERLVRAMHALELASEAQHKADEEFRKKQRESDQLAQSFADAWGQAFTDFITGAASAEDAVKSLIQSIIRLAVQEFVVKQFKTLFQGAFSPSTDPEPGSTIPEARGDVFDRGRITAFAAGGIVTRPTFFPMRGGAGLMGEAGPEAVMPLKRGADGRLGVEGGGGTVVYMTVYANDADSFRRSKRQIIQDLKRGAGVR